MPNASSAQTGLAYVTESIWGTTPASPTMKELRCVSESIDLAKGNFRSQEFKFNRMVPGVTHGVHEVAGQIECEFGDYLDDLLESACFGRFATGVLKVAQTRRILTIERRLHTLHMSMRYTGCLLNGFNLSMAPESIAKITFPVIGKTCATATDALGGPSGWLVNDVTPPAAGDGTVTVDTGTVDPAVNDTFMFYKAATPTEPRSDVIYTVTGYAANVITFTPVLDVNLVDNDILHFIRPSTAVTASDPMNSFSGAITEGGSAIAVVTGVDLNLVQGIEANKAIGSNQPNALSDGGIVLSGTLRAYIQNLTLYNKFINETASTLQFSLDDGTTTYTFLCPDLKYMGAKINKAAGGGVMVKELPFEATYDASENTVLKITKA